MITFKDKIVFITGGSRGIGAACVRLFHQAGAKVIFSFKENKNAADALVNSFATNLPFALQIDFNSENDIVKKVVFILTHFGRIDILVNNAGVWKYGEADKISLEDWNATIQINLTSTFLVTKEVLPSMKKNKFGRIINISSTAGQRGEPFYSHYAASKGGIISYTKSLASELGKFNINTNCVAPGWVDTEMVSSVFSDEAYKEKERKAIPVQRIATAEDIAGPVLFLASDLARHINGEILNVNGGSILCG
ncbi:MAG: alcohol dehydrogenase [Ignavibacteria bacterium CG22_combo_CG10-13_8_21_14_all_37_15]|nr:MAG: alcohol dehydrogenase [Ignavibacteria bacterium CG22_combo_CG10-13_8_21_14_all_37_15]